MNAAQSKPKGGHFFIVGNDEFEIKSRASILTQEQAPDDPMNFEVVNGYATSVDEAQKQIHSAIEAIKTLPFFGGRKVVHFKDVNCLGDTVIGRNEGVANLLEEFANSIESIPAQDLTVILSALDVDKRRSFYKKFSTLAKTEIFDQVDISKERDLEQWLDEVEARFKKEGLTVDPAAVERLVDLVGSDSRALQQEIEKLKTYLHPSTHADEASVRTVCCGNREIIIWDFCDAVLNGNANEALTLSRQLLAQDQTEVGLLILLGQQLRLAAIGKYLEETKRLRISRRGSFLNAELIGDAEDLLSKNKKGEKPNLFRLSRVVQQSKRCNSQSWFQGLEIVHHAHEQVMTISTDRQKIVEDAVLKLCLLN